MKAMQHLARKLRFVALAFYLVHQLAGYAVIARLEALGAPPALALAGAILFALALAQAIHTFVETPALKAIRLFWRDRQLRALA